MKRPMPTVVMMKRVLERHFRPRGADLGMIDLIWVLLFCLILRLERIWKEEEGRGFKRMFNLLRGLL